MTPEEITGLYMLTGGVGFYRNHGNDSVNYEPTLHKNKYYYYVFSHEGEYIGTISCDIVCSIIHKLRANRTKYGLDNPMTYEYVGNDRLPCPENLTFGWSHPLAFMGMAAMDYFHRKPAGFVDKYWN